VSAERADPVGPQTIRLLQPLFRALPAASVERDCLICTSLTQKYLEALMFPWSLGFYWDLRFGTWDFPSSVFIRG